MIAQCDAVLAHCSKQGAALGAKELTALAKDKKIAKLLKEAGDDVAEIQGKTKDLKEIGKAEAKRLAKRYIELARFDDGLGEWETVVQGWKEGRPGDIRLIGGCFKAMQLLFQVGT